MKICFQFFAFVATQFFYVLKANKKYEKLKSNTPLD
jgi:uncharacterized membrane protein (DUF485 family)